ncbi:MAG: hypothetical protein C5B54_03010, partial [Acidobacteria bacterium]
RLVRITSLRPNGEPGGVSYPDFLDWQKRNSVFENIAVFGLHNYALSGVGNALRIQGAAVSSGSFRMLGTSALKGRTFSAEEDRPGSVAGTDAVILSYGLWQERFGSDKNIIGRKIELNRNPFTVVGVMPRDFQFPIQNDPVELWTTIAVDSVGSADNPSMTSQRGVHYLSAIARLKPNVSVQGASANMTLVVNAMNLENKDDQRGVRIAPELQELVGDIHLQLLVLWGAVGCVLLIACANIANLLLAQATTREQEIAVRLALGAGRVRIVRQLLTENISLSLFGGAAGLILASLATVLLKYLAPVEIPRLNEAQIDSTVLLFTFGLCIFTSLIFGLIPALQTFQSAVAGSLKGSTRSVTSDSQRSRIRAVLIVLEVAVSLILLVAAGLLIQTLARLHQVNPGFDAQRVVSLRVDLPDSYSAQQEDNFFFKLLADVQALPDVHSASSVLGLPLSGIDLQTDFRTEKSQSLKAADLPGARINVSDPGYFRTMGIALRGRDFEERDNLSAPSVVIINEALAREYFAGEDPIGKRIKPGVGNGYKETPWRTIVGVAADVHQASLKTKAEKEIFLARSQCPFLGSETLVIQTKSESPAIAKTVQSIVASLDRTIPVSKVKTVEEYLNQSVTEPRFNSVLFGIFAFLSAVLAAIGIYGVISYSVAQQTHEIGIRVALGAAPDQVMKGVVGKGIRVTAIGIFIGIVISVVLSKVISGMLFGVQPYDPFTFIVVIALLTLVALAACAIPARRAMQVNPVLALRHQ